MLTQNHLKIGSKLPDFNLPGIDGKNYTPSLFKDSKVLVVMFTCNHCPYVQAYEQRLIDLQSFFKDKLVSFVAINSNNEINYPEDSFENMIKRAKEKGYNFPYLRDQTQEIVKKFGASYTPEVFVFDQNKVLKYHGRIDDNYKEPKKVTKQDLKEAIEAVLANKEIKSSETQAIGCTVKWAS
ncbi:MAG: thioredoxin family protein [Candidatus Melainabacteria bacterium]|nr:thioredoxin family protein [Candidatus Melainabacteria bacterium]